MFRHGICLGRTDNVRVILYFPAVNFSSEHTLFLVNELVIAMLTPFLEICWLNGVKLVRTLVYSRVTKK